MKIGYIYKITAPDGKMYIGQTFDIKDRVKRYRHKATQRAIMASMDTYGYEAHVFETVWQGCTDREGLFDLEQVYIKRYNTFDSPHGLNLQSGGKEGNKASAETRALMSAYKKPKHVCGLTAQRNRDRVWSAESREKLAAANRGKKLPQHVKDMLASYRDVSKKIVLNFETGIFYDSSKEAAFSLGVNYKRLSSWMIKTNGRRNLSSCEYV